MPEHSEPDPIEQLIIKEEDLKIAANIYRQMMVIAIEAQGEPYTMNPYTYFTKLKTLDEDRVVNYLAWRLAKHKLDVRIETEARCGMSELRIISRIQDSVTIEWVDPVAVKKL